MLGLKYFRLSIGGKLEGVRVCVRLVDGGGGRDFDDSCGRVPPAGQVSRAISGRAFRVRLLRRLFALAGADAARLFVLRRVGAVDGAEAAAGARHDVV